MTYLEEERNSIYSELASNSFLEATEMLVRRAFDVLNQKLILTRAEFKKYISKFGWKGEEKRYIKLAQAFGDFSPNELSVIEPRTLFQLAENTKYKVVIEQLRKLNTITQEELRRLIKEFTPKPVKKDNSTVWRELKNGDYYCYLPPVHDPVVGVYIQTQMNINNQTPQEVIQDLVYKAKQIDESILNSEMEPELTNPEPPIEPKPSPEPPQKLFEVGDIVESTSYSQAFYQATRGQNLTILEICNIPGFIPSITVETDNGQIYYVKPGWIKELKVSDLDKLVDILRTATTWEEIKHGTELYYAQKSKAWEMLNKEERIRVSDLTPIVIKKLTKFKKEGLIIEFAELGDGIYRIYTDNHPQGKLVREQDMDHVLSNLTVL
jgi:hypothetical protein